MKDRKTDKPTEEREKEKTKRQTKEKERKNDSQRLKAKKDWKINKPKKEGGGQKKDKKKDTLRKSHFLRKRYVSALQFLAQRRRERQWGLNERIHVMLKVQLEVYQKYPAK